MDPITREIGRKNLPNFGNAMFGKGFWKTIGEEIWRGSYNLALAAVVAGH